ncbi:MAG: site-specific integrase, partial [Pseudomonadales bacterium]|nr:site-specific integrase [Pseudomonadales bacterium]
GTRTVTRLPDALFALQQQKRFTFLAAEQVFHHVNSDQQWFADQAIRTALLIHALTTTGVR